ncbi:MAG: family 20 glycosylhydrolase [Mangrovibacterium sp.]
MTKHFILGILALAMLASCGSSKQSQADYEVIPLPQKIEMADGEPFILNNATQIVYPDGNTELERVAQFLADYIQFATGKKLALTNDAKDNAIMLAANLKHENPEAYALHVCDHEIEINGASAAGAFYGVQTLRKSIDAFADGKEISFAPVEIEDFPRFSYRGMHLDVGRHFFSVDFIKEYIDLLALHNMNKFHWHLTEDQGWRIEIKKYPELTEIGSKRKQTVIGHNSGEYDGKPYGGFYTQEEAKEIVQYAADRFITVIPEIDLPGHMLSALATFPHLGCTGGPYEVGEIWGVSDQVLCAGNEDVYTFIDNVLSEIIEIFPSEYIHIGGDECPKTQWKACPKCQAKIKKEGLKADKHHSAEERLQSYLIARVEKMVNDKGRQIIGWDEILEGGLAPNATVMSWRGISGGVAAAKEGHDVIMTPNSHLYFDYYQTLNRENVPDANGGYIPLSKVYDYNPVPADLSEEEAKHIIGAQANLWSEYMPTSDIVEYRAMPRMSALAEVQWTMPAQKDYSVFLERLARMLKLYDKKGYNYSTSIYEMSIFPKINSENGTIELNFYTIDNAPIYYTLDGTTPTEASLKYDGGIVISESVDVQAEAIRPNLKTPSYAQSFHMNKATAKPITFNIAPHRNYTFTGATALVDGVWGNRDNYKDGTWIGFYDGDLEAVIDLKAATEISEVELATYVSTRDWVFGAESFKVSVSDDGTNYKVISEEKYPCYNDFITEVKVLKSSFDAISTRYVKINVGKTAKIPSFHVGAGSPGFIFIDEIQIN